MAFCVLEGPVLLIFEEASLVNLLVSVSQVSGTLVLYVYCLLPVFASTVFVEELEPVLI